MKKLFTLTIVTLLLGFTAKAQFEIRPTAGINLSNLSSSSDGTSTSAKVGFQAGGYLMFGKQLYVSPGIMFIKQVTEYSSTDASGGTSVTTGDETISGFKIPLLVGFRFIDPKNEGFFNLRVFAGPSVLFNTKNEFSNGTTTTNDITWKSSSWGARVGAGLDLFFLFVDAGYEFGLSNTIESNGTPDPGDTKHNTFLVNFGIRLKI